MSIQDFFQEWGSRRRGRRHVPPMAGSATRDIIGPTGFAFSAAWEELEKGGDAYLDSFDRRLPPSIFVSERDRLRAGQPMPVVERCIEDWGSNPETEN